jgi:hypothetical protein
MNVQEMNDEIERLKQGYRIMLQFVSDSHKLHYKIAKAVLEGKDMRKMEDVERLDGR